MKRFFVLLVSVVAACAAIALLTLPPARTPLEPAADGTIAGSIHIHTNQSDGRSTPDEIAAIAAHAGLQFLVFTDHGDGTRPMDPPTYRAGVLCLDGVEISTSGGHYIALDMPASPYPLAGEPRDVVEDVRRLGGFGIAAHPDSPKPELRWRDWTVPVDAVEWVNPDTSWRVHAAGGWRSRLQLALAILHYPLRPAETVANLTTPAEETIARWESSVASRRTVVIAGADAHARLALRAADPVGATYALPIPGYDASLEALSVHAKLDTPLTGRPDADAAVLMRAIRGGHLYVAMDGLARPPSFEFTATNALGTVHEGDQLGIAGPVTLHVRSNAPSGFTTIVWRGHEPLVRDGHAEVSVQAPDAGVYRVAIESTDATRRITWLYSNPIYVGPRAPVVAAVPAPAASTMALINPESTKGWHLENDARSTTALNLLPSRDEPELRFDYTLAGGPPIDQRAVLVWGTVPGTSALGPNTRVRFIGRANRPLRLSIQLRTSEVGRTLGRWQRSVYLDQATRRITVDFDNLTPTPDTSQARPPLERVNGVLFVVDTTNTKPGSSGRIWLKGAALER